MYSLGILSYCLLVGHPPFEGTDPRVTIDQTLYFTITGILIE